jgi:hypothetical protein
MTGGVRLPVSIWVALQRKSKDMRHFYCSFRVNWHRMT